MRGEEIPSCMLRLGMANCCLANSWRFGKWFHPESTGCHRVCSPKLSFSFVELISVAWRSVVFQGVGSPNSDNLLKLLPMSTWLPLEESHLLWVGFCPHLVGSLCFACRNHWVQFSACMFKGTQVAWLGMVWAARVSSAESRVKITWELSLPRALWLGQQSPVGVADHLLLLILTMVNLTVLREAAASVLHRAV